MEVIRYWQWKDCTKPKKGPKEKESEIFTENKYLQNFVYYLHFVYNLTIENNKKIIKNSLEFFLLTKIKVPNFNGTVLRERQTIINNRSLSMAFVQNTKWLRTALFSFKVT